ncbi:right-handed parallel beta-helix repeat-containing protein [bacterium]|nr:right-handed parallel beta-helix repeat-containing protein [bacterium]
MLRHTKSNLSGKALFIAFIFVVLPSFLHAAVINVPDDAATIQGGVDLAIHGDTVLVAPGIYYESGISINQDIVVGSHFIITADTTYIDSTIVDGSAHTSVFYQACTSVIAGFTIRNGRGASGGGIENYGHSSTIAHNIITGNIASSSQFGGGGGIALWWNSCTICNNKIIDNVADGKGGGIWVNNISNGNVYIYDNIIENNHGVFGGGGIACMDGIDPVIEISNNVIRGNSANHFGGGIYCNNSNPVIHNNTFNNNSSVVSGASIFCTTNANPDISNNTIEGGAGGFWHGGAIGCDIDSNPEITRNIIINHQCISIIETASSCVPQVRNNTFYSNSSFGELIQINSADVIIENNIFMSNGGIVISSSDPNLAIGYNDFYDQPEPLFSGSTPPGIGVLSQVNTNSDSCDVYYNIFMDPLFADTLNMDFNLTGTSPCIDAGDPVSPYDPDGTIADMGAFYFHQTTALDPPRNVTIEISAGEVTLSWDAVAGANSYKVYSSEDPYTGFVEDSSGSFDEESWSAPIGDEKKFYHVIASTEVVRLLFE